MYQVPDYMYEPAYQDQTQTAYSPGNNPDFNAYNSGWGAQPDFSWQSHPVVTPVIQGSPFVDEPYNDMPDPHYQSSPITYSPSFKEKVLQAIDQIESIDQSPPPQHTVDNRFAQIQQQMLAQQHSLDEQMYRTDQLLLALNREEEGDLPSPPESNLEGQYLAQHFNDPLIFLQEPTITLRNELVLEPLSTTIKTSTKAELYKEQSNWWDEPIPLSPYLPITPFPSALESSMSFNGMGDQINVMMELVETSQTPQMDNIIEEATPIILSQDLQEHCLAHIRMDNFHKDGYSPKVNNSVDTPYFETIPLLIENHESPPSLSIVPLLESPCELQLKPLLDAPIDTLPVIPNQEDQLLGVLKMHKEAVGWDIHDFKNFITKFSVFGTTFEDCLQNLSTLLKQCMEAGLILIWTQCHGIHWEGVTSNYILPEIGSRADQTETFLLPPPISTQQK